MRFTLLISASSFKIELLKFKGALKIFSRAITSSGKFFLGIFESIEQILR
jgi:hypothetical protein